MDQRGSVTLKKKGDLGKKFYILRSLLLLAYQAELVGLCYPPRLEKCVRNSGAHKLQQ